MESGIVTDGRTLRALVRAGYVEWEDYRERHWTGASVRRRWVQPGPKLEAWYQEFTHRGKRYRLHYVDGCFHPFVCEIGKRIPAFV